MKKLPLTASCASLFIACFPGRLAAQQAIAPAEAVVTPASTSALPHDLSPIGMFMAADVVVKGVMIGLAIASVVTWTVLLVKLVQITAARRRMRVAAARIAAAETLDHAMGDAKLRGPAAHMVRDAAAEFGRSASAAATAGRAGLMERVNSLLAGSQAAESRQIARGTGILATIGSTAPFVGLFGTVWGIMNSFIGISQSQTTNLAVVAPGIAEALLATAMGLVAAIPAVVFYNFFARNIGGYRLLVAEAAAGIERLVSRDLDFQTARAV